VDDLLTLIDGPENTLPIRGMRAALAPVLRGHEIPELLQPAGWHIDARGVWRLVRERADDGAYAEREQQITTRPILITGKLWDVTSDEVSLVLEWHTPRGKGGRWTRVVVPAEDAYNRNKITRLASLGAPISSDNARHVSNWLYALTEANLSGLPEAMVTRSMGWQGRQGEHGYLCGRTLYRSGAAIRADAETSPMRWPEGYVHLDAPGGIAQAVAGYEPRGSWEGWTAALDTVLDRPAMALALLASLVPPLMRPIPGIPNFGVDWYVDTSQGKTTALYLAASVWGNPSERDHDGTIQSWGGTRAGIEALAQALGSLPLILDDTKQARRPETVADVIYAACGGRGNLRSQAGGGLRDTPVWRTVLISSGEQPALTLAQSEHGGAAARLMEVEGSPMGEVSREAGQIAKALKRELLAHHGHAGPRVVQWLQGEGIREGLRARYRQLQTWAEGEVQGGGVESRASDYVAALQLAAEVCEEALGLAIPEDWRELVWSCVRRAGEGADISRRAMADLVGWLAGQGHRLYIQRNAKQEAPPAGWLGSESDSHPWAYALIPSELDRWLRGAGYRPAEVIGNWERRGWLLQTQGKRVRVQIDGRRCLCIGILRGALDEVGAGE
jgi:putative DNA primase/helicase